MSNKISAIVIDDEKLARDIIKDYLNQNEKYEIVDECRNGFEGIKSINQHQPDIIFLDIQMPKISGFEMLELIDEPPIVIFTTAFDQYALKAFEVNATDYLLKPYSQDRFNEALQKAELKLKNKTENKASIKNLIQNVQDSREFINRIVVKKNSNIVILPTDSIEYLEAQDDYVMIYSSSGTFLKSKTMKYFEEHLDPNDFVRIHRSYIVRIPEIKQLEQFEKDSYRVLTNKGSKLPVSKTGYAKLKELLS